MMLLAHHPLWLIIWLNGALFSLDDCTMQIIGVLIIDDHPAVRLGLEAILNRFADIKVLATAESGRRGIALCRTCRPDVALVDIYMEEMDGISTIAALKREFPTVRSIALTHSEDDDIVIKAVDAGATGYLLKTAKITAIADAIRSAASGRRAMSPEALEAIIRARTGQATPPQTELTQRELDVLALMVEGLKNPQIAESLHISVATVKFHVGAILRKLGAKTRTEAVVLALEAGLVQKSDG